MIRLYFNKRGGLPWSIDKGKGTEERNYYRVVTDTTGSTHFDPNVVNKEEEPCAWVEFPMADVIMNGEIAVIRSRKV